MYILLVYHHALCWLLLTRLSLCSLLTMLLFLLLLCFSAQHTLLLTRYANFVYLGFRRSLAYLHLSAASPPSSVAICGNCVCVLSSLECNLYRLLVASLTAGLNIVPITENSPWCLVKAREGTVSGYYRNLGSLRAGTRHHGGRRTLSVLLFGLALAPAHFLEVHGRSSFHPLRASGMRVLNYLDDWLILAQSRDTPASHIDKLLRHLEFLRLCVNMCKSILAPSQSNVSGSVLRLKAVETRARPPVCLPCAFSNWTVYYTCARCSLAEISSHLDGVDFGPFAHRGPPRLHRISRPCR